MEAKGDRIRLGIEAPMDIPVMREEPLSSPVHLGATGTHQLHRATDLRQPLLEWLKNGVPADVAGDVAANKKIDQATRILQNINRDVFD